MVLEIIKILMMIMMVLMTLLSLQIEMKTSTGMEFQIILIMTVITMVVRMSLKLDSLIVMETIFWVTYKKLNLMKWAK